MATDLETQMKRKVQDFGELKQWVDQGGDPGWTDTKGFGLLHSCAFFDAPEVCEYLLQFVDVNMQDVDGISCLAYAAAEDSIDVVQVLLNHGADMNIVNQDIMVTVAKFPVWQCGGLTPLHWACKRDNVEVARLLIEYGADPSVEDFSGATPSDLAMFRNSGVCYDLLNQSPEICCDQGHPLAMSTGLPSGYCQVGVICDACMTGGLEAAPQFYHCTPCEYDLCVTCAQKQSIPMPPSEERKAAKTEYNAQTLRRIRIREETKAAETTNPVLKKFISGYTPKHPELYTYDPALIFHPALLTLMGEFERQRHPQEGSRVQLQEDGVTGVLELFHEDTNLWDVTMDHSGLQRSVSEREFTLLPTEYVETQDTLQTPVDGVFMFPCFTEEFCRILVDEVEFIEAEAQRLLIELHRPNSMNRYGMVLNEVGFQDVLDELMNKFVSPLAEMVLPTECGCKYNFKEHYSFIIRYRHEEDIKLDTHTDSSDITLNVCLGKQFTGGKLYFHSLKHSEADHENGDYATPHPPNCPHCTLEVAHEVGHAVIHRGDFVHGANPIDDGERANLIMWCTL